MVTMEQANDQEMMYIPQDVRETLKVWADVERKRAIKLKLAIPELITWKSLGVKALRNACQASGHYVGKVKQS